MSLPFYIQGQNIPLLCTTSLDVVLLKNNSHLLFHQNECQDSLKALHEKQQRTVYRLTLVKGWNTEDIEAYSGLFDVGNPDFIEIKGVTYCGS